MGHSGKPRINAFGLCAKFCRVESIDKKHDLAIKDIIIGDNFNPIE